MAHIQQQLSAGERAKVCARYGIKVNEGWQHVPCHWCGDASIRVAWSMTGKQTAGWATGWGAEFDHLIPLSKGGPNTAENVVIACRRCNRSRCNRDAPSWLAKEPI